MNAVGIVATLGPKTNTSQAIRRLLDAGATVFRLNGSHSDLRWHTEAIEVARGVDSSVPILLDIPGTKVRTRDLGAGLPLEPDQTVIFGLSDSAEPQVATTLQKIPSGIEVGQKVLADDGTLEFELVSVGEDSITCRSLGRGVLGTAKGLNFPNAIISDGTLTDRDHVMLSFALEHGIDFVGISFVHSAEQVQRVREFLGENGPQVLAKIENQAGYENRLEVISSADAIMIDRGDLAAETGKFEVGVRQGIIVHDCIKLAKPVIVATEMMHSMISSPFPTKAEVSDVTTAVLQGASATMLSGETAVGDFPFDSVNAMSNIIAAAEASIRSKPSGEGSKASDLMLDAAANLAESAEVDKCIVFTRSGYAAQRMSSRIHGIELLVVSDDDATVRRVNLLRGVRGFRSEQKFQRESADFVQAELRNLLKHGLISTGQNLLVTGLIFPRQGDRQNFVLLTQASD